MQYKILRYLINERRSLSKFAFPLKNFFRKYFKTNNIIPLVIYDEKNMKKIATFSKYRKSTKERANLSDAEDLLQFSKINFTKNQTVPKHKHLISPRQTEKTSEIWIVIRGVFEASIYDNDLNLVKSLTLRFGDAIQFHDGGHELVSLKNNSIIFEVKNGPYKGEKFDRVRF
jgi:cupin fold WbuC family metalloprotein